ncbi:Hsp20/alpha crystallin family protein [Paenibacillus aurantius]|uniref:Hsp20/alpha crystallin family protein n=1 Tax=Paenibacillus aurantius TaxID=2918900 RepID=A0AA96LD40_9BACL|nr:Hsp20/alpha crystallin family protein [Paenibacillus aurantius]WJH34752.1 Hsp20/alpha crystallin family protein [Paenibacillus sp. CC-CFT747]WNQ09965.1 Hsp20/alpha crystallin family protein [Paenibacillus aurantius]
MSSSGGNEPWKTLHNLFGVKLPFADGKGPFGDTTHWVEPLIQDILSRTIPKPGADGKTTSLHGHASPGGMDFSWLEGVIRDAFKQAMPGQQTETAQPKEERTYRTSSARSVRPVSPYIRETDKFVTARFRISEKTVTDSLRIFVGTHELRLEGLPGGKQKTVSLPAPVKIMGSQARYGNGVLEVKMPKRPDGREQEIFVRYR